MCVLLHTIAGVTVHFTKVHSELAVTHKTRHECHCKHCNMFCQKHQLCDVSQNPQALIYIKIQFNLKSKKIWKFLNVASVFFMTKFHFIPNISNIFLVTGSFVYSSELLDVCFVWGYRVLETSVCRDFSPFPNYQ